MPEVHLIQPEFTYNACGAFTKNKERTQKFKKAGDSRHIFQNELDKICFQHVLAYRDFKDLPRRTTADKILRDKEFIIAEHPRHDGYHRGLGSTVYTFSDKKTEGDVVKNEILENQALAEELHEPIVRKFEKRKVHSPFTNNIWGADLTDMPSRKFIKGIRFLLCVFDIHSKCAWVIPLKDKKETLKLLILPKKSKWV